MRKQRDAPSCFKSHRDEIDGVIVTLPNFGDERAIADTLRMAGLKRAGSGAGHARHSGPHDHSRPARQLLRQDVGVQQPDAVRHSLFTHHSPHRGAGFRYCFARIWTWFAAVCRVVRGLRRLRIGAIGARPAAFNTVRYSEKILEANGISVETIDLSEILGRIARMTDQDAAAQAKLEPDPTLRIHRSCSR